MVTDTPKINSIVNTLLQDYEYVFEVRVAHSGGLMKGPSHEQCLQDKEINHSLTAPGKAAACCRALYDYDGQSPDEISFKKGSIIKIIHERVLPFITSLFAVSVLIFLEFMQKGGWVVDWRV